MEHQSSFPGRPSLDGGLTRRNRGYSSPSTPRMTGLASSVPNISPSSVWSSFQYLRTKQSTTSINNIPSTRPTGRVSSIAGTTSDIMSSFASSLGSLAKSSLPEFDATWAGTLIAGRRQRSYSGVDENSPSSSIIIGNYGNTALYGGDNSSNRSSIQSLRESLRPSARSNQPISSRPIIGRAVALAAERDHITSSRQGEDGYDIFNRDYEAASRENGSRVSMFPSFSFSMVRK